MENKTPDELLQIIRELKLSKPFNDWDKDLRDKLRKIKMIYHEKTAHYEIREGHSTASMTFV